MARPTIPARAVARFVERFEVDPATGCWNWTGGLRTTGYGKFYVCEEWRYAGAHQVAYELWVGPREGLCVLHTCDNRICICPDHLFRGTVLDNNRDMVAKGRHFTPWRVPRPIKLTSEDVASIRARYVKHSRDAGLWGLAREFGVSAAMVHNIVTGKAWTHELARSYAGRAA